MQPLHWQLPIELSATEQQIVQHIRRARLFVFLREYRHEIFDAAFQEELASLYQENSHRHSPVAPALLALATLLQAYTGVSDDEVIEASIMDRRWQLVLGLIDIEGPPFSKGTLVDFRKRLIQAQMAHRLINRAIETARRTGAFGGNSLLATLDGSPLWATE